MVRAQILSKNSDAVAIPDSDLHITLAAGSGWQKLRSRIKAKDIDEPEFSIDIDPTIKVIERGGSKSWYVKLKNQQDWKEYVMDSLQGTYDSGRVYHITLANLTGEKMDSVAMVDERVMTQSQKLVQMQHYWDNLSHMASDETKKKNMKMRFGIKNIKLNPRNKRKILSFEEDRDYKDEYKKFQSSKKSKKYRAELNRYNRRRGTYGNGDKKDASHRNGKIVGFEDESVNRGRAEKSRLKVEEFFYLDENITPEQLSNTKKAVNKQFSPLGMSVDLQTRHFQTRKDDTRNVKPISSAELIGVFKRAAKKWKSQKFTDTILKTVDPVTGSKDQQAVIYDPRTDINIAAVLNTTRSKSPEFVIKTIMRKKDFKTRSPKLEL